MQQADFLPGNILAHSGNGADSQGINDDIQRCNLYQHGDQLFRNDPFPAYRMGQQKFRCFVLFFLAEYTNGAEGRKKGTAQPQHIAALHSVKPDEGAKVQPIHAERLGK